MQLSSSYTIHSPTLIDFFAISLSIVKKVCFFFVAKPWSQIIKKELLEDLYTFDIKKWILHLLNHLHYCIFFHILVGSNVNS